MMIIMKMIMMANTVQTLTKLSELMLKGQIQDEQLSTL